MSVPENPTARNRARRGDPYRRAVGAPRIVLPPVPCPLGKCEHAAMAHRRSAGGGSPPEEYVMCVVEPCDCEGAL